MPNTHYPKEITTRSLYSATGVQPVDLIKRQLSTEATYDYIIVGSGAAGCVLATRLAEDGSTVLVLEEGHNNSRRSQVEPFVHNISDTPAYFIYNWFKYLPKIGSSKKDYIPGGGLLTYKVSEDTDGPFTVNPYPRGNGSGGSTRIHAMVSGRGSATPYDQLAKDLGNYQTMNKLTGEKEKLWSYADVKEYQKKMEVYYPDGNDPMTTYSGPSGLHNTAGGWLAVSRAQKDTIPVANITEAGQISDDMANLIFENFKSKHSTANGGLFQNTNLVDPSDPITQLGFHIGERHIKPSSTGQGQRSNSYEDLLVPAIDAGKPISVLFNTLVDKVVIDKVTKEAKGVSCYEKGYLLEFDNNNDVWQDCSGEFGMKEGMVHKHRPADRILPTPTTYYARKEVILTAGAWATPGVLLRSGIGPKADLVTYGIEEVVDSPHVGKNVLDHLEMTMCNNIDPTKFIPKWQAAYLKHFNSEYYKTLSQMVAATPINAICIGSEVTSFGTLVSTSSGGLGGLSYSGTGVSIDGVSLEDGMKILLADQTTHGFFALSDRAVERGDYSQSFINGVWEVSTTGSILKRVGDNQYDKTAMSAYYQPGNVWYATNTGGLHNQYHYQLDSGTPFASAMTHTLLNPGNKNLGTQVVPHSTYVAIKKNIDFQDPDIPDPVRNPQDLYSNNIIPIFWDDVFLWDSMTSTGVFLNENMAGNWTSTALVAQPVGIGKEAFSNVWSDRKDWAVNQVNTTYRSPSNHSHFVWSYFHNFNFDWGDAYIPGRQGLHDDDRVEDEGDLIRKFAMIGPNGNPSTDSGIVHYPSGTTTVNGMIEEATNFVNNPFSFLNNKTLITYRQLAPNTKTFRHPVDTAIGLSTSTMAGAFPLQILGFNDSITGKIASALDLPGFENFDLVPQVSLSNLIENLPVQDANPTGSIKLNTSRPTDPRARPFCVENLTDNEDILRSMFNSVQAHRHVYNNGNFTNPGELSYYLKPYWLDGVTAELSPGKGIDTFAGFKDYMKKWSNYGHHISGTARWGTSISNGVIDATCRVFGVKNLRVGDTSCSTTRGYHMYNTSISAYTIAERLSDLIIDEIPSPK